MLLVLYMNKMSICDHENLIANFDCICCQNLSLKTKFIPGFIYLFIYIDYIRWVYKIHILYMF